MVIWWFDPATQPTTTPSGKVQQVKLRTQNKEIDEVVCINQLVWLDKLVFELVYEQDGLQDNFKFTWKYLKLHKDKTYINTAAT